MIFYSLNTFRGVLIVRFGAFFVAGWRGAREGIKGREPRKKKNVYMWALDHV